MNTSKRQLRTRLAQGFSLVELLVVVAIIALLLTIAISVGPGILGKNNADVTRTTLEHANIMVKEYLKLTNQRTIPVPGGLSGDEVDEWLRHEAIHEVISTLVAKPDAARLVQALPEFAIDQVQHEGDDELHYVLLDSWGNELYLKTRDDLEPEDENDDIRLPDRPRGLKYYLASPGQDGEWGDSDLLAQQLQGASLSDEQNTLADNSADNLYSYELQD